jgi:hypothetical protein
MSPFLCLYVCSLYAAIKVFEIIQIFNFVDSKIEKNWFELNLGVIFGVCEVEYGLNAVEQYSDFVCEDKIWI